MGRAGRKKDRLNGYGRGVGLLFDEGGNSPEAMRLPPEFDPARPEVSYAACVPTQHRKHYGQFFTPPPIAELMCDWVAGCNPKTLLDPAVGTGMLVRHLLQRVPGCTVTALDKDEVILAAARESLGAAATFLCCDFLSWDSPALFDAAIANPPYLRHHDMLYSHDVFRAVGNRNGVHLSRLTNAYGLFILEICRRLAPGGRAAIIVPGEWLNANFGMPIKEFLLTNGLLKQLVYFSHASLIFEDALTTACLLFIEKNRAGVRPSEVLHAVFVHDGIAPDVLRRVLAGDSMMADGITRHVLPVHGILSQKKWDYVLQNGIQVQPEGFVPLSHLATTCRGIATGANAFFHLSASAAKRCGIEERHLKPCVGKAIDAEGFVFDQQDFARLAAAGRPAYLAALEGKLTRAETAYVSQGEAQGLPRRYLLAARSPWYKMESRPPAPIWAAVFGRSRLKFVWNRAGVFNLTTFHCIYPRRREAEFAGALVACLNSRVVQRLCEQQQRVYGGGLRKFEPRDLLDVPVLNLEVMPESDITRLCGLLERLDRAAREGPESVSIALDELDEAVTGAAAQATTAMEGEPAPEGAHPLPGSLPWEPHRHRGGQDE